MSDGLHKSLQRLSTSSVDSQPRSKRNALLNSVIQLVSLVDGGDDGKECRSVLAEFATASSSLPNYCRSIHSSRRMSIIIQNAIIASCVNNEEDSLKTLCLGLCQLLARDSQVVLLDEAVVHLSKQKSLQQIETSSLSKVFVTLAQEQSTDNNASIVFPALSLAAGTSSSQAEDMESTLMELFLSSSSLASSNKTPSFPQPNEIKMAKYVLSKCITQSNFDTQLAPALGLKLRSHPESVLPLLHSILSSLLSSGGVELDVSTQFIEGGVILSSTMKHFKSSKVEMRNWAWKTCVLFCRFNNNAATKIVVDAICDAFSTLTTSDVRAVGYAAMDGIGRCLLHLADNANDCSELANKVLSILVSVLPKDKILNKSAATDTSGTPLVAKEVGYNALTTWMQLFRKFDNHTVGSGYDKALGFLVEPLNKYSPKDGEFKFRFGSLIQLPSSSYLGDDVITSDQKVTKGGEAFLELLIVDLIEKKKIKEGLESVIDAATKKFASSDSVAQVDGTLAVFFLVVNAHLSSEFKLSPLTTKVVAAGGTVKGHESSFLYSLAMLESAKVDALLNFVLHRIIALHYKVNAKSEGGNKVGRGADQPLVRIIEKRLNEGHDTPFSAATKAMAVCAANPLYLSPVGAPSSTSCSSIQSSLKTVVTYSPATAHAADAVLFALFSEVNERSLKYEDAIESINETRSSREQFEPVDESFNKLPACCGSTAIRGKLCPSSPHKGYDPNSVRLVANELLGSVVTKPGALFRALILSHAGTAVRSNGRQRIALVSHMLSLINETLLPFVEKSGDSEMTNNLADFVAVCAASKSLEKVPDKVDDDDGNASKVAEWDPKKAVSTSINDAALSLITTLGGIAGNFDTEFGDADDEEQKPYSFASDLCIKKIPVNLVSHLDRAIKSAESMTEDEIALLQSPKGILFSAKKDSTQAAKGANPTTKSSTDKKKAAGRKKGVGFDSFADEEWEKQVKKDLAKKKKAKETPSTGQSGNSLTAEEKITLAQQTKQRDSLLKVLRGDFPRSLAAIRCLCESDIEVGNSSLPIFGRSVIGAAVSSSNALSLPASKADSFDTLSILASCVYEIDETHAATLARALTISFGSKKDENALAVSELPSPCAPAACSIFEIDDYGDCLSGNSFAFLFPIIQATLTGPRNIPGCHAAVTVLERHCVMLAGDEVDVAVKQLRKDIANTLLELLHHDRSQTYVNPSPYDALKSCYVTDGTSPGLTAPEIAPLLGDQGALGGENNRVAAMETLTFIATKQPKLVRNNPLIENRIWLNCYDESDRIRMAARRAWLVARGHSVDVDVESTPLDSPSKMYAVPLLPLLSNADSAIASAAAASFTHAVGMHPGTAEKNIVKLCNTYIGSFPAPGNDVDEKPSKSASPFPVPPPPAAKVVKKKVIDTGLPKKKKKVSSVSTSMSKITGAPAPKKSAATKKLLAKVAAPKKERTLDQDSLMDQFKSPSTAKKETAEADSESKVSIRKGILRAISSLTDPSANVQLDLPVLKILLSFLMSFGLGDGNEGLRNASRDAARDFVALYCSSEEATSFFLPQLEAVLNSGRADESNLGPLCPKKVPKTVAASDFRKEGVVVSLGSIALHLKDDAKIDGIVDMLLKALNTPSEDVQSSVALCLSKLMKKGTTQQRVEALLDDLMNECINGNNLASRRGAAYGISAVVKGSGIASLKKFNVVKRLEETCTSGSPASKEGSLFAIELLSSRLGILFEPYVIVLLPALLKAFSDSNDHVRSAADKTVGLIMAKLSGHGVKLVMPAVLEAFNEPEWRTKQASIHMLGSMSHCAPKQLASCLPKVVPKLTEAFSDTHPKVKKSAQDALEEICTVIKNPEISSISETIVNALTDPANGTLYALEALISTEFLHAIDAPSLSIIIPVVHRGLRDRAANTKRYAALISGNICTMVNDARDFVPYLPILLPDLKSTLLDPIPDVRSITAKALGSLTRGVGEATFPDLRPWLVETLRSEGGSSVERSGAAQGLTEILVAGGASMVQNVMVSEILPLNSHPKAGTREGVLWVLTFLPSALGQAYASLIDESLPALLGGLADDNETVRDVALRAGRVLVKSNGKAHKDKILPSLENGLSNEDYRIRVASLTLLGDLLSMLGGTKVVKGNADTQDDIRQAERAQAQIALVLGNETRRRVLSSLYLARSDTAAVVRQAAVQVWKTVVSVTPRTLREILSELVDQIVTSLASGDPERTQVAGRCLGDIVQKLGDQVLPEVIPVLRDSLYRGDENTRQGVCVGLAEVIASSSKEQIIKFINILVKVVQDALCDEHEQVRKMATQCFQSLFQVVGTRTLDEVVPALLVSMESEDEVTKARGLNGVTGILSVRSKELLPYIIPRVLKAPMSISHADALGSISAATSQTIHMHFNSIIPTLIMELSSFHGVDLDEEEKSREEAVRCCSRVLCHNVDTIGVNWLISEVINKCTHDKDSVRKEACWFIQIILEEREKAADFYDDVDIIIREVIHRLNDDNSIVLKANNAAIRALTKCVPAEELVKHIRYIKDLIGSMVSDARYRKGGVGDGDFFLPGLNIPKGLEPLLPIYQRGILYGDATTRELAASGLGDLIKITKTKYLAGPFLIKLTGPLLRIVGDRNPPAVKIAIVQTLGLILTKGGPALRAFVPQFQTTFVKALSDPSRQVRIEAIAALALLMPLSTRVDPLIKELVSTSLGKSSNVTSDTAGLVAIQTATLEALAVVLKHGGKKVKLPESVPSSLDAGKELLLHDDDGIRESAAKVVGHACELLGVDEAKSTMKELVIDEASDLSSCSPEIKHGIACVCRRILSRSVGASIDRDIHEATTSIVLTLMKDEKTMVKEAASIAIGAVLGSSDDIFSTISSLEKSIAKNMDTKEELSVQQGAADGLRIAAGLKPGVFRTHDGLFLINCALKMAMSGSQRVQFSYNDFLWVALDVQNGEVGLNEYLEHAYLEEAKKMKAIYTKVLVKIKSVKEDD